MSEICENLSFLQIFFQKYFSQQEIFRSTLKVYRWRCSVILRQIYDLKNTGGKIQSSKGFDLLLDRKSNTTK